MVFSVPIAYFFLPPPSGEMRELADTERPMPELYVSVLGREWQLEDFDERLAEFHINNPEEFDDLAAAIFGSKEAAANNWHDHYRTWRKKRVAQIACMYGDQVAEFLAKFANQITQLGPTSTTEGSCSTASTARASSPMRSAPPSSDGSRKLS
jgi:hypothetical protein